MVFKPRISGASLYHHIYAWGNDRHPIFKEDFHYHRYLKSLQEYSLFFGIEVIAYALMLWHIHLFVHDINDKISEFILNLHGDYARYYNRITKRVGHVFGERFNNRIVQPNNYALWLSRYIHRQALEAGLVNDPQDYPWTSYRIYIGLEPNYFLKTDIILKQFGEGEEVYSRYKNFVMGDESGPIDWKRTRKAIIGETEFIEKIAEGEYDIMKTVEERPRIEEVLEKIFGRNKKIISEPCGKVERALRHKAIKVLWLEYKYTKTEIARAFGLSVAAISKVLNNDSSKVKS